MGGWLARARDDDKQQSVCRERRSQLEESVSGRCTRGPALSAGPMYEWRVIRTESPDTSRLLARNRRETFPGRPPTLLVPREAGPAGNRSFAARRMKAFQNRRAGRSLSTTGRPRDSIGLPGTSPAPQFSRQGSAGPAWDELGRAYGRGSRASGPMRRPDSGGRYL